jgi:hypothetical protein
MPRQAVALKKYRCGTSPISKISDNEHATPALGNSEELSVKNAVGEPIPEFPQEPEEGSKCPSVVGGQDAGDVLPYQPAGPNSASKFNELDRELTTLSVHARSESSDAEVLARCSADKKVNWSNVVCSDLGKVPEVRHRGKTMRENRAWKLVDLRDEGALPAQGLPCDRGGLDTRTHAAKAKRHPTFPLCFVRAHVPALGLGRQLL